MKNQIFNVSDFSLVQCPKCGSFMTSNKPMNDGRFYTPKRIIPEDNSADKSRDKTPKYVFDHTSGKPVLQCEPAHYEVKQMACSTCRIYPEAIKHEKFKIKKYDNELTDLVGKVCAAKDLSLLNQQEDAENLKAIQARIAERINLGGGKTIPPSTISKMADLWAAEHQKERLWENYEIHHGDRIAIMPFRDNNRLFYILLTYSKREQETATSYRPYKTLRHDEHENNDHDDMAYIYIIDIFDTSAVSQANLLDAAARTGENDRPELDCIFTGADTVCYTAAQAAYESAYRDYDKTGVSNIALDGTDLPGLLRTDIISSIEDLRLNGQLSESTAAKEKKKMRLQTHDSLKSLISGTGVYGYGKSRPLKSLQSLRAYKALDIFFQGNGNNSHTTDTLDQNWASYGYEQYTADIYQLLGNSSLTKKMLTYMKRPVIASFACRSNNFYSHGIPVFPQEELGKIRDCLTKIVRRLPDDAGLLQLRAALFAYTPVQLACTVKEAAEFEKYICYENSTWSSPLPPRCYGYRLDDVEYAVDRLSELHKAFHDGTLTEDMVRSLDSIPKYVGVETYNSYHSGRNGGNDPFDMVDFRKYIFELISDIRRDFRNDVLTSDRFEELSGALEGLRVYQASLKGNRISELKEDEYKLIISRNEDTLKNMEELLAAVRSAFDCRTLTSDMLDKLMIVFEHFYFTE